MKKLFLLAITVALFGCQTESNYDETTTPDAAIDKVANLMAMEANPDLDLDVTGLYKGIFATYDLGIKGEIILNVGNDLNLEAAVRLVRSEGFFDVIYFTGRPHDTESDSYIFESPHGSFVAKANDQKEITIKHFNFNGRDTYITAFKATRGADVTFAFGTYVDDLDAGYTGNWDAIHQGRTYVSPAGGHSTNPTSLLLLDKVVVSRGATMITSTDTPADDDQFEEPCFYTDPDGSPLTVPHAWYEESDDNTSREFVGHNITTNLGTGVATWTLAYYTFSGAFYYDLPACVTPAASGYGIWSWGGRAGKLYVTTIIDL